MYDKTMLSVFETPEFIQSARAFWDDEQRMQFIDFMAQNPEAGDVIPGTGGLRKIRWAAAGHGKRGGARVIYFVRTRRGQVVLVTAYNKGRIENIPAHLLRKLMEKYDAEH